MEFWMIIPIAIFGFIYIVEKLNKIEKKTDARLKRMEDRLQLITKEMGIVDREPEINKELRQLMEEEGKQLQQLKSKRSFWFFFTRSEAIC